MGWFKDAWDDLTGKTAAEEMSSASKQGADANLAFQREALDYMKQVNAPKLAMQNQAMQQMGGLLGLGSPTRYSSPNSSVLATSLKPLGDAVGSVYDHFKSGGAGDASSMRTRPRQSQTESILTNNPLYQAQMANIAQQQENAQNTMAAQNAATGGLRGGNYQRALMESSFDADRARQNALAQSYQAQMSGLAGLAGLDAGSGQIAQQMSNMGNIAGMGITGAAQSGLNAQNAQMQNLLGLGGLGIGIAGLFSDERLKSNIVKVGEKNGLPWYSWEWNEKANELGQYGYGEGHLAGEVEAKYPDAVHVDKDSGYKKVNYEVLNG